VSLPFLSVALKRVPVSAVTVRRSSAPLSRTQIACIASGPTRPGASFITSTAAICSAGTPAAPSASAGEIAVPTYFPSRSTIIVAFDRRWFGAASAGCDIPRSTRLTRPLASCTNQ
jgi:hypothetical protein